MNNDSVPMRNSAHSVRALASVPSSSITLSNIGPWSWFVCDYAIAFVFAAVAFSLTPYNIESQQPADGGHVGQLAFCFGTGLLVALIAHISGLHETIQGRASLRFLGRCAFVCIVALFVLNVELVFVHYLIVGRLITLYAIVGCTFGLFAVRALVVGLVVRNQYIVGFVGSEKFTRVVPEVSDIGSAQGVKTVSLTMNTLESVDLLSWALDNDVNQIVVDPTDSITPSQSDLLRLMNMSLCISSYSNYIEKLHQKIPSEHINAQWVIECQNEHAVLYKTAIKRALDIVIASITLIFLFPVGLIAAISVKLDSPGPVIFRQARVGQYGRSFTMLKLRTMVHEAEKGGAQMASISDSRVTLVGNFLRRSRIDEIPQLLNVLAGDMSLVGPRPERPEFTPELESRIPFFIYRLLVKPGITGWAQINAGYAATEAESTTKLSYDLYYVKNLSLGLDLRILLRTISSFASGSR
ncbi:exopolysaccharide biosynthesis polyprenyl glycosylphosphotransferase [Granulosicoccus sp.]|nr:exopolysaccharide biosynthesis polyprenyl glycosylphosphotransferase [Granulosicoccus sp.]MDB4224716.1 exopolysaccharide biosynthesis polyprenyl glycosylphosphotransferase [Granulosicoccus sp.]